MTPDHANFALPSGITDADLVDLVDGCLAPDRQGVVVAAVSASAHLRTLVGQMRSDRVLLGAVATEPAPPGLAEGIEVRLQALALRDLASASSEAPASIPISTMRVRVERPGVLATLLESVWTRRLAMAATIAIVGAGAAWGVSQVIRRAITTRPLDVASVKPVHAEPAPVTPEPAPVDIASIDNSAIQSIGPVPTLAMATPAGSITEDRAAELAREGRLVITIHTGLAQATMKRLDTLARAGSREGWRTISLDKLPAEYAALTTPSSTFTIPGTLRPDPSGPVVASGTPVAGPAAPHQPAHQIRIVVKRIYTAEVNPGDRWLGGLIHTVADALPDGAVLELREAPAIASTGPAVDPDSVLWWSAPPAKWARKTTIPIVVEGLE
jgi:hypothetical protein